MLGRAHRVHDVVEARALVHQRERLLDERLQQLGAFGERLVHALGADDRQPVSGQQDLGLERVHLAERERPSRARSAAPSAGCRSWATPR